MQTPEIPGHQSLQMTTRSNERYAVKSLVESSNVKKQHLETSNDEKKQNTGLVPEDNFGEFVTFIGASSSSSI